jgi:hypothetical protein
MAEPYPYVWTILLEHDGKAVSLKVDTEGASLNTDRLLMLREAINGLYWQWWYEHGGPKNCDPRYPDTGYRRAILGGKARGRNVEPLRPLYESP